MSSDDDVPAPSPSAAVLARRASREASGSEGGGQRRTGRMGARTTTTGRRGLFRGGWERGRESGIYPNESGCGITKSGIYPNPAAKWYLMIPILLRSQKWDQYHFSGTQLWQPSRQGPRIHHAPSSYWLQRIHAPGAAHPDRGRWGGGDRPGGTGDPKGSRKEVAPAQANTSRKREGR